MWVVCECIWVGGGGGGVNGGWAFSSTGLGHKGWGGLGGGGLCQSFVLTWSALCWVQVVRYLEGRVVSTRNEKYVIVKEGEEWDGGSKGKVRGGVGVGGKQCGARMSSSLLDVLDNQGFADHSTTG